MKKIIITLVLIVSLFTTTTNVLADDAILYVDATAEESTADGSSSNPYKTIQKAIDEAEEGDTIIVASGDYYETLEIYTDGLTLRGAYTGKKAEEGRTNSTKVMFPDSITNTLSINLLYVDADDVTIDGFDFVNIVDDISAHTGTWAPIYLDKSDDFHFINNYVDINTDFVTMRIVGSDGISKIAGHGGTLIENNFIRGIHGWSTVNLYGIGATVENNTIIGGSRGLQVQVVNDIVGGEVKNNTITAYATSIYHNYANRGSASWTYEGNTLLRGEVNNSFRPSSGAPDYMHWTGFFIETFGAEHYPAVGMVDESPKLIVNNNVIDGVSKCQLSRTDFLEVVGLQFKSTINANPNISFTDNEFKFVTVGVINTANHRKAEASIPMFSLEQVSGNIFDDTNTFKGVASLDDTERRINLEKYTVEFVDHEDKTLKIEENILYGECAKAPDIPPRDGYNIIGWDKSFDEVTKNMTVSPVYELIKYKVTFVDKDGNIISEQNVLPGQSATAPTAPTVKGFKFIGWDRDFSNVTTPLTVRAQYKVVEASEKPKDEIPNSGQGLLYFSGILLALSGTGLGLRKYLSLKG